LDALDRIARSPRRDKAGPWNCDCAIGWRGARGYTSASYPRYWPLYEHTGLQTHNKQSRWYGAWWMIITHHDCRSAGCANGEKLQAIGLLASSGVLVRWTTFGPNNRLTVGMRQLEMARHSDAIVKQRATAATDMCATRTRGPNATDDRATLLAFGQESRRLCGRSWGRSGGLLVRNYLCVMLRVANRERCPDVMPDSGAWRGSTALRDAYLKHNNPSLPDIANRSGLRLELTDLLRPYDECRMRVTAG